MPYWYLLLISCSGHLGNLRGSPLSATSSTPTGAGFVQRILFVTFPLLVLPSRTALVPISLPEPRRHLEWGPYLRWNVFKNLLISGESCRRCYLPPLRGRLNRRRRHRVPWNTGCNLACVPSRTFLSTTLALWILNPTVSLSLSNFSSSCGECAV